MNTHSAHTDFTTFAIIVSHLHPQTHGVEHDEEKHQVLKVTRRHDVPHLVLIRVLRDVAPQRSGLQGVLDALALIQTRTCIRMHT